MIDYDSPPPPNHQSERGASVPPVGPIASFCDGEGIKPDLFLRNSQSEEIDAPGAPRPARPPSTSAKLGVWKEVGDYLPTTLMKKKNAYATFLYFLSQTSTRNLPSRKGKHPIS